MSSLGRMEALSWLRVDYHSHNIAKIIAVPLAFEPDATAAEKLIWERKGKIMQTAKDGNFSLTHEHKKYRCEWKFQKKIIT